MSWHCTGVRESVHTVLTKLIQICTHRDAVTPTLCEAPTSCRGPAEVPVPPPQRQDARGRREPPSEAGGLFQLSSETHVNFTPHITAWLQGSPQNFINLTYNADHLSPTTILWIRSELRDVQKFCSAPEI